MNKLLDNVSVNTNGSAIKADGSAKNLSVWASNFGTGTVTFQVSPDGGTTWITPNIYGSPAQFTVNTSVKIDFAGVGMLIRATLTGSNGSTSNVSAAIF